MAFGQEEGEGVEPFLVGLATLALLTEEQRGEPSPVRRRRRTLARHRHGGGWSSPPAGCKPTPVAFAFTAREGDAKSFTPRDIPVLSLRGLEPAAARLLMIERSGVELSDQVTDQVLVQTDGNPLALVELPLTLSRDQLEGEARCPASCT